MLPLDFHAHIEPSVKPEALLDLGACVIAVTRSLSEFAMVADRRDDSVAWGIGVHPGVSTSHEEFSPHRFRALVEKTPVVGEIGMDRRSPVSLSTQKATLEAILEIACERPRILNVHSAGSTGTLLDVLQMFGPKGMVLHWWRGTVAETRLALDLGCWFSINAAEVARPRILKVVPKERILTETDHPFGDRRQLAPRRPGGVNVVEAALAKEWNVDGDAVRRQVWRNFVDIAQVTGTADLFPSTFQRTMLAA